MRKLTWAATALAALLPVAHAAAQTLPLRSPDGRIEVEFALDDRGTPGYRIAFDGREVIALSALGLDLGANGKLAEGFHLEGEQRRSVDQRYTLPAGKTRQARDHFNEVHAALEHSDGRRLGVILRAYDDGVALRYVLPATLRRSGLGIREELTRFAFPRDYACWALNLGRFGTSHEGEFDPLSSAMIRPHALLDLPLVCHTGAGDTTFALAEADLTDYAGLYLSGRGDGEHGVEAKLSPRLDQPGVAVRVPAGEDDFHTPWRVVMLGEHPGRLIESTLLLNLNPPSRIDDTSWIRPGKSAWDWWSGGVAPDVPDAGMNDATMRRYIDHAAALRLDYMLIDDGWYVGSSGDGRYHETADITRAIPQIDLPALVRYAGDRRVGLWLWAHWKALDTRMDEAFAYYAKLGIKGVKVDFMDRDDQVMVEFYHRLLRKAAEHKLLIDLHGAYHPTGLNRTWPNFLTQEGVLGAEYNKWSRRITATHNVTLPFTRMLLGPMDYTPGGFRNVTPEQFTAQHFSPQVMTTRAQQLAMFVVYESALAVVADSPDAYTGADGADFLRHVPASWDETRVIAGAIGEYIVVARRHGREWYVGAMGNEQARELRVPLDFLDHGSWQATLYQDGVTPTKLRMQTRTLKSDDSITLKLAPGGGAAVRLVAE
ncbi:glycoside hydrolase family 97 protein [Lysobacter cavernae]|uniref:Glycoside hydrolase family 97 protein n=1 Tax=Lysobacter cavernae TaxID=1685901 RepID=A0ABV7RVI5_9GAMM